MKILVLSNMYPSKKYPSYGTFVDNFVKSLALNNISLYKVISIKKTKNNLIKLYYYFKYVFNSAYAISRRSQYDLIYIHYPTYSLLPLVLSPFKKCKFVLNYHGDDLFPRTGLSNLLFRITRKKVNTAELIIVPSLYYKEVLQNRLQIKSERIIVSPSSGINLEKFHPGKKFSTITFDIGFLSRIDEGKGWDIFIETLSLIDTSKINFHAFIGGDGKEFHKLEEEIKRANLSNRVTLYGAIPHKDIPSFFNKVDVLIFPSTRKGESLGLVALEALACGVPVIAKDNGAIKEFISHGNNGYIFTESIAKQIYDLICKFSQLSQKEKSIIEQNAVNSVKKYDSKVVSRELFEVLKTL